MSGKRIPRRVQINGEWYDVSEWMGGLDLVRYASPIKFTAREPFVHMTNFFYVYDAGGSKVGEFQTHEQSCYRSYSGCVTGLEE